MKQSSTKPQGATSYKETAFGIISRSKLLKLEIEGTKKGLEYISEMIKRDKNVVITAELICKLHDVSFGWIFPKWAGKYRKIQVTFSDKAAPSYFQVPELIKNLCEDLSERLKHLSTRENESYIFQVVKVLAWFQHRYVFIHPFQDYNGRTARMLTIIILLKLDLPPIELLTEDEIERKQYITAMQEADEGNFDLLEKLMGDALRESFEKI